MEDTGIMMGFTGNNNNLLDPRAQEFRPRNHLSQMMMMMTTTTQTLIHEPQPQIYYQYPSSGVHVIPFSQQPLPAYFTPSGPPPPPPLLCPPPETVATRSLLLSYVPVEVNEDIVRREMEVFGEVRSIEMERLVSEGIVVVHFYDLRQGVAALMEIQSQHMKQQNRLRHHFNCWGFLAENCVPIPVPPPSHGLIGGKAVWAEFISPSSSSTVNGGVLSDWRNQGTIVVLNLDGGVSVQRLKEIFEAFGPVKEVRLTPLKKHQRFVEFFDIRDAARALLEMDGKEINGQFVTIQFSRPGGNRRISSSISPPPSPNSINRTNSFYTRVTPNPSPSLPLKLFRRSNSNSSSSNSSSQSHQHVMKSGFGSRGGISTNSNDNNNGGGGGRSRRFSEIESSMGSLSLGVSGNGFSEEENSFNGGGSSSSSSSRRYGGGDKQGGMMKQPRARSWKNHTRLLMKKPDSYFLIKDDTTIMADSNIIRDPRTTVMIKNIPNKYSQKLLLNMLDSHCIHCNEQITTTDGDDQHQPLSAYDFVYLPIDFNNKCNVGYGFVNMTSPQATLRLYKAFHKQQWEVFNSRKICEVTYARLQGLEALKEHFKNSKFACETDDYLPVVFSPPRDGKQLTDPIPMGGHPQNRCSKMKILLSSSGGSISSNNGLKGGGDNEWSLEHELSEKKDDDNGGGVISSFKDGSCEKTQLIPKVGLLVLGKKKKIKSSPQVPPIGCLASSSEPQQQQKHGSRSMLL